MATVTRFQTLAGALTCITESDYNGLRNTYVECEQYDDFKMSLTNEMLQVIEAIINN
jgi:hypothetical protein